VCRFVEARQAGSRRRRRRSRGGGEERRRRAEQRGGGGSSAYWAGLCRGRVGDASARCRKLKIFFKMFNPPILLRYVSETYRGRIGVGHGVRHQHVTSVKCRGNRGCSYSSCCRTTFRIAGVQTIMKSYLHTSFSDFSSM